MGIFTPYDVINHLPRRYENLNYTEERNLEDKQRVVVKGKLVALPRYVRTKRVQLITFDFITAQKNYFKVVAYNRQYLMKTLSMDDEFTIVGSFSKKNNDLLYYLLFLTFESFSTKFNFHIHNNIIILLSK